MLQDKFFMLLFQICKGRLLNLKSAEKAYCIALGVVYTTSLT